MDLEIEVGSAKPSERITWAKLHLMNLYISVFNTAYYIGLCPVRFGLHGNQVYMQSCRLQKMIAALLAIIYCIHSCARLKRGKRDWDLLEEMPSHAFNLVLSIGATIFWMTTLKRLWFNTKEYFKVLQTIQEEKLLPVTTYWFSKGSVLKAWYAHLALKILASFVVGHGFVMTLSDWSPAWWFQCLVAEARFTYSFTLNYNITVPEFHEITFVTGIFAAFTGIGILFDFCFFELADMLLLVNALILWIAAKTLRKRVLEIPRDSRIPDNIFGQYLALEGFSGAIGKAVGSQVIWYVTAGLPYYSIFLTQILVSGDVVTILRSLHTFIANIGFFYTAAKIGHEVALIEGRFKVCETPPFGEAKIGISGYQWLSVRSAFIGGYIINIATLVTIIIFNKMATIQVY